MALEVYDVLGYGMAEEVYQHCLEIELGLRSILFQSKADIDVACKGQTLTTGYRPDDLVFGEVVVEPKAGKTLAPEHEAQCFNYMRISKKKVGYLINFGASKELEWKRFAR